MHAVIKPLHPLSGWRNFFTGEVVNDGIIINRKWRLACQLGFCFIDDNKLFFPLMESLPKPILLQGNV